MLLLIRRRVLGMTLNDLRTTLSDVHVSVLESYGWIVMSLLLHTNVIEPVNA